MPQPKIREITQRQVASLKKGFAIRNRNLQNKYRTTDYTGFNIKTETNFGMGTKFYNHKIEPFLTALF